MNITRQDMIEMMHEKMNFLEPAVLSSVIETLFDVIINELKKGNKIEFRNFGRFSTRQRKSRQGHNPKTLIKVSVPAKKAPVFKIGRQFKDMIIYASEKKQKSPFNIPANFNIKK